MNIKLTKGRTASPNDIATLEQKIGVPLVYEFLEFVSGNDGSKPEDNIFKIGTTNDAGVNRFIPIEEIPKEMASIDNLPIRSFPIAWVSGGNYVFINQDLGGAVFFWDHEQPDDIVKLATGFRSFLDLLEPFDISSIKLKPGQVNKAWIDPDFLKSLQ